MNPVQRRLLAIRRQSHSKSRRLIDLDDEFVQTFLTNRGVTPEDVNQAFALISKDGRKISREDIKSFTEKYFRHLGFKQQKFISQWKEDTTLESLSNMLLNKPISETPFEEAFEWFHPEGGDSLDPKHIKEIYKSSSKYLTVHKHDHQAMVSKYDFDNDGKIGLEDFKKMSLV